MILFSSGEPMSGGAYAIVVFSCICAIFVVNWLYRMWDDADAKKAKEQKAAQLAREQAEAERKRREAEETARKRTEAVRIRDEKLKRAMEELENDTYDRTLWAKALIMADGSQSKAKAMYLRLRIGEL